MPAGRPSKFVAEYHIPWVRSLARRGLTVGEIARDVGVSRSTLNKWVAENAELSDALNEGRQSADSKVEESLYRKALGFTYTEKKTIVANGKDGQQQTARIEIVEREVPPDTTACIFWLKNRMSGQWREQNNIVLNTSDDEARKEVAEIIDRIVKKEDGK